MSLPDPLPEDPSYIDHSQRQEVNFLSVMHDELIESYMSTYTYVIYMPYINENKFYLNGWRFFKVFFFLSELFKLLLGCSCSHYKYE